MAGSRERYELLRKLAVGGMGEVWLARERGHQGVVVIKKLRPHLKENEEFVNMFFDEARIAASLDHPNIVQIFDLGEEADGEYFIAMEYVHGYSLQALMAQPMAGFTPALKARVISEAALALHFAHGATTATGQPLDFIHRDVSPPNVLIGFDGSVKLIDFGVAKAANKLVRTANGIIKGKFAYMSPEQAYGRPLDARSDVFGLGVVLWELLTDSRLFKRATDTETLKAVVGDVLRPPSALVPGLGKALDTVVMTALKRELSERYQSAALFKEALDGVFRRSRTLASASALSLFMRSTFTEEVIPVAPRRATTSVPALFTGATAPQLEPVGDAPRTGVKVLGEAELAARIAATGEGEPMRGFFFNALLLAVMRSLGPSADPEVRRAAKEPRGYVDALEYPTREFLRLLWKAVNLLAPTRRSVDEAFELLGQFAMEGLFDSALGASLTAIKTPRPELVFAALLELLAPMISPGTRTVLRSTRTSAVLLFKGEVLPMPFFVGLFRALCGELFALHLKASWERQEGERFELTLRW